MRKAAVALAAMFGFAACAPSARAPAAPHAAAAPLYDLGATAGLSSRMISFENPTGAPGAGGQAASPLGVGRKGAPMRQIEAGERVELAAIEGAGMIRHIWMTTQNDPRILRGALIRVWWDGQDHPSIEAPLGDFFGFAHGRTDAFQSTAHSVGVNASLNIWLPMPFARAARIELVNESGVSMPLYYSIDYTLGDAHPNDFGRLHVLFRRENPTTRGRDFELLPERRGHGRFIGAVIGVRPLAGDWWGEGEFKAYLDGDTRFATLVGTGSEDYVGQSWGLQRTAFLNHGANWIEQGDQGRISMYRWHVADPIIWRSQARVTMQQIGCCGSPPEPWLSERRDDWSVASFWYEPIPGAPLPPMPDAVARLADLPDAAPNR
jgi:hypothetical protein